MSKRYTPPKDHEPEGQEFGKPWRVPVGTTFIVSGAMVRSIIDQKRSRGMVAVDLGGKWNHAAEDTLALIIDRDTAKEIAAYLTEAVAAAEHDEIEWKRQTKS